MKARLPRVSHVPESTLKDIKIHAREQCIEQLRQYEMELDSVTLYVLHTEFGFGKQRLERFYHKMFELREAMQAEFGETDDSTIGEFAMRHLLKNEGIDVEEMFSRHKSRFIAKVK
jgi:predicted subunit of tRNA(5-methylaminomethyl-2-thiouridylate) methyltransferase